MNPAQSSLGVNLPHLLFAREINDGNGVSYCTRRNVHNSNKRKLEEWQESDSLHHCSASYAEFNPAPRSTIALSHSCDGTLLASTHGDHTVKITECGTGCLVWVLSGHRRTPWVVRFHPKQPHLLASGSLDHEVRLWDATTGTCLARHTFGKPIASLAFHPSSPLLAIACGHKLYVWNWTATDTPPQIVLKTRRSMRAVHFHPHGVPLLLTAEVQDPSSTRDLPVSMTEDGAFSALGATRPRRDDGAHGNRSHASTGGPSSSNTTPTTATSIATPSSTTGLQRPHRSSAAAAAAAAAAEAAGWVPPGSTDLPPSLVPTGWELPFPASLFIASSPSPSPSSHMAVPLALPLGGGRHATITAGNTATTTGDATPHTPHHNTIPINANLPSTIQNTALLPQVMAAFSAAAWNIIGEEQPPRVRLRLWSFNEDSPFSYLEAMAGALRAQISDAVLCSEMGVHFSPCGRYLAATVTCRSSSSSSTTDPSPHNDTEMRASESLQLQLSAQLTPSRNAAPVPMHIDSSQPPPLPLMMSLDTAPSDPLVMMMGDGPTPPSPLPHRVVVPRPERVVFEVRILSIENCITEKKHVQQDMPSSPTTTLTGHGSRREMVRSGTGGGSAAGIINITSPPPPPTTTNDNNATEMMNVDKNRNAMVFNIDNIARRTSQEEVIMYNSNKDGVNKQSAVAAILESSTRVPVVKALRIRAAHCLTSVQFSPTSNHLLLAYGKKHISLLRSLVAERGSVIPLHTIMEVFSLNDDDDMSLVGVLPSGEDEINAAAFHPLPGGGLAYGTKEGKLRMLAHDRSMCGGRDDDDSDGGRRGSGDNNNNNNNNINNSSNNDDVGFMDDGGELPGLRAWLQNPQSGNVGGWFDGDR